MAPILASSKSKSKLRAFQFNCGKQPNMGGSYTENTEAEKENIDILRGGGKAVAAQLVPRAQSLSQRSIDNDTRECPQTPVGRLALAELIASGEDSNHQSLNLTPTERVLWDQSPHNSAFASSAASRIGKKRAHSSSPASSSQNEASNHFTTNKASLDLQTLQKCLKTPQADPANDLWSRYSVTNEQQSPTEKAGLPFAHLLNSSSPQTPASHLRTKESGGLRRSVSCTTEWPTSVSKRRKLEHSRNHIEIQVAFAATEGENTGHSKSKRSRVSLLVDRLHDELAESRKAGDKEVGGPSSSSPLPEKGGFSHIAIDTATPSSQTNEYHRTFVGHPSNGEAQIFEQLPLKREVIEGPENTHCTGSDSLSDYGDEDLDLEMLKTVDAHVGDEASAIVPENEATYANFIQKPAPQAAIVSGDDEFDDDGNDVSAADLEDAVAMYDLQPQAHKLERVQPNVRDEITSNTTCATPTTGDTAAESSSGDGGVGVVDLSSDEEFGGALDFEQIIAECAEATQGAQVASQPQSAVCTRDFGQSM